MPEIVATLVSTVIPVHNRPQMVRLAVESVLEQDHRPIEIIIVDDGSTDDTLAKCKDLADIHPGVVEVISRPNGGPGLARETGRRRARGEFIQYLDSDDRLLRGKFTEQVTALRENPDCDIAYGITRLIGEDGKVLVEPFKWTGEERHSLFPGLLVDRWWCTHTPLYRRAFCDEVGPWSDLRYSQDWEYDARAGARRAKLYYCNSLVSEHRHHDSTRQTGAGNWLAPVDQVRFFSSLYKCALQAGVCHSAPEMRHFSRWVFASARNCGTEGEVGCARALLELAWQASAGDGWSMQAYGFVAALLGWKAAGMIARGRRVLGAKKAGGNTMKQSWMGKHF